MTKTAEQKVNELLDKQGYVRVPNRDSFYARRRKILYSMLQRGEVTASFEANHTTYSKVTK